VKHGFYQIPPCALRQHLDAHEVIIYADVSGKQKVTIRHEIYLDLWCRGSIIYAKNAAAIGETDRLYPSVLAAVDPQAFWSAMLWFDTLFVQTIQDLDLSANLLNARKELQQCRNRSKSYFSYISELLDL